MEDSIAILENGRLTYTNKYIYNTKGDLIEERMNQPQQSPLAIFKYKVVNGNRVEQRLINTPPTDTVEMMNPNTGEMEQVVTTFHNSVLYNEFYADKLNMPLNIHYGNTSADKHSKNLIKRTVQLSEKGDTMDIYSYRYTFDNKGRVLTIVEHTQTGTEYDSTSYSYY